MVTGVYMILHRSSGKIYIGSSLDIETRWKYHRGAYGSQVFHRAIRKHGVDAFDWILLEECNEAVLIEREQYHLDDRQPFGDRGYNIRRIADRNSGVVLSEETKKRMSEARRGVPKTAEQREKMRQAGLKRDVSHLFPFHGRPHSEETKRFLSEKSTGRTWKDDDKRVAAHRALRIGKTLSPEHIEKVRQSHLGSKRSVEAKGNMSAWQQREYVAVSPEGIEHVLCSRDLPEFFERYSLNRPNFCKAAITGKPYKKWIIRRSHL